MPEWHFAARTESHYAPVIAIKQVMLSAVSDGDIMPYGAPAAFRQFSNARQLTVFIL